MTARQEGEYRVFSVRLPIEVVAKLERRANVEHSNRTAVIRRACEVYLKEKNSE
jgi:metal-responsive CopG/Arc/MetJ family transcriptional regulator